MTADPLPDRAAELDAVATPALVLDEAVLERTIAVVAASARERGFALRPHAKSHKSLEIAHRQIAAGAVGISRSNSRSTAILITRASSSGRRSGP